jgi:hypothetical protein
MPPKDIHDQRTSNKSHRGKLQLRYRETTSHSCYALNNQPTGLAEGKNLGECIGLAWVFNIFLRDGDSDILCFNESS